MQLYMKKGNKKLMVVKEKGLLRSVVENDTSFDFDVIQYGEALMGRKYDIIIVMFCACDLRTENERQRYKEFLKYLPTKLSIGGTLTVL